MTTLKSVVSQGSMLRHLRSHRGVSLRDLAERTDLTTTALGRIERGEDEANKALETLIIQEILDISSEPGWWNEEQVIS